MDDVIKLLVTEKAQDSRGAWHTTRKPRQVFCRTRNVSMTEFFEGGRNGLNPELQFTIFKADYKGETEVEYKGFVYSVYRTYETAGDYLELYVERKGGSNGSLNKGDC